MLKKDSYYISDFVRLSGTEIGAARNRPLLLRKRGRHLGEGKAGI
jgi:hypothetical protein